MENHVQFPKDVGIVAMEVYVPVWYVDQVELEQYDKVSSGKYTVGLGQNKMAFCNDREDINSLCLTVVQNLLDNYKISPKEIGRLEVGTETIIDKSKSVKTVLMQLFKDNDDLEGIDTTNACYGGTAALFNALNWIESSAWDNRYALVVCADIAVYAKGPARPTGGAGAIAILLGANAPLVVERGTRASYMAHAYDFYKPNMSSEYPVVDGLLSIQCYFSALDKCYQRYITKQNNSVSLHDFNGILFHCPFSKLVQKSVARLYYIDCLIGCPENGKKNYANIPEALLQEKKLDGYYDREAESILVKASSEYFKSRTEPSLWLAKAIGNMYTPSLYGGLVSYLLQTSLENLRGARIGLFSYGSGLASSFYAIRVSNNQPTALERIVEKLSTLTQRIQDRVKIPPSEFEAILVNREKASHSAPFTPVGATDSLFPGTFYLTQIDDKHRRTYNRSPSKHSS